MEGTHFKPRMFTVPFVSAVPSLAACFFSDVLFEDQERKLKRAVFMIDRASL